MVKNRQSQKGEMGRVTASVFRNGKNQAIRIPVDMSLDTREVTIEKRGDALIIRPKYDKESCWDSFFDDPAMVLPDDFDTGDDPPVEDRDLF